MPAAVIASAVVCSLEDDVNAAAACNGCFEIGGGLAERVRRVADKQDPVASAGEELVEDGGGESLLARRAGAGPHRSGSARISVASPSQTGAERERDSGSAERRGRPPDRRQHLDGVYARRRRPAWYERRRVVGRTEWLAGGCEREHLGVAETVEYVRERLVERHVASK